MEDLSDSRSPVDQTEPKSKVRGDAPMSNNPSLPAPAPILDLSKSVKGMYRILDLISEQGSGGLGKLYIPFLCL